EIVVVGSKGLGSAERTFDSRLRQHGHAVDGALEVGLHPFPIRRDLGEGESFRNCLDAPRPSDILENTDQDLARILPDIRLTPGIPKDRQFWMQADNRL